MNEQESGDGENEGSSEESELNESASSDEVSEERHESETGEGGSRNNRDSDDEEKHSDMQGFSDEELYGVWENHDAPRNDNKYIGKVMKRRKEILMKSGGRMRV